MRQLANLQAAVHLFLQLTGGPSAELCQYLLCTIDFLDDTVSGRLRPAEINELAMQLTIAMAQAVTAAQPGKLSATAEWAKTRLDDADTFDILMAELKAHPTCKSPK